MNNGLFGYPRAPRRVQGGGGSQSLAIDVSAEVTTFEPIASDVNAKAVRLYGTPVGPLDVVLPAPGSWVFHNNTNQTLSFLPESGSGKKVSMIAGMVRHIYTDTTDIWAGTAMTLAEIIPLTNLALWLKADALTLADNDPVGTWTDSSPTPKSPTSTGSNRPIFKDAIINGLPVVRFATDDYLTYVGALISSGAASVTVFVVAKLSSFSGYPELLEIGDTHNTGFAEDYQFYVDTSGGVNVGNIGDPSSQARGTAASTLNTSDFAIISIVVDGAAFSSSGAGNPRFFINGVSEPIDNGTGAVTPNISPARFRIGANLEATPNQYMSGDIAELIVYSSALADTPREQVEAYLAAKYAL